MNVASLELCKELYELSGWELPKAQWHVEPRKDIGGLERTYPAYDLGYLLRKLPDSIGKGYWKTYLRMSKVKDSYAFAYMDRQLIWTYEQVADTPEDAACRLAIELFKQGILNSKEASTKGGER